MKNVIIYGIGTAGKQVYSLLSTKKNYYIKAFFDDNIKSKTININNIKVFNSKDLEDYIISNNITDLILAISNKSIQIRKKLFKLYHNYNISIYVVPLQNELINNKLNFHDIRKFQDYDFFIPRENKKLDLNHIDNFIANKTILITGGAGSIGSELCYQLIKLNAKKIIIIDFSELNLYNFLNYINSLELPDNIQVKSYLLNLLDKKILDNILIEEKPNIIYHAAAYKHVSITENNILFALKNNILSLDNLLKSIKKLPFVERFLLVSTDKAVNPTTVMGFSKKICEDLVRHYSSRSNKISYSIVRFGNVVGSSGSVFPKFIDVIKNNEIIKITNKNVERYMMSISEAAKLIIIASIYSNNSYLYVLNMGKPIKILHIANKIAFLFDKKLVYKNTKINSNNSIFVDFIGLSSNEKISENLLNKSEKILINESDFMVVKFITKNEEKFENLYNLLLKQIKNNNIEIVITYMNKLRKFV
jgi:FlaA1/EpsC-like NDP-sugar epimerase